MWWTGRLCSIWIRINRARRLGVRIYNSWSFPFSPKYLTRPKERKNIEIGWNMHVHTRYTCILVSLYMVDNLSYTLKSCTVLAFENWIQQYHWSILKPTRINWWIRKQHFFSFINIFYDNDSNVTLIVLVFFKQIFIFQHVQGSNHDKWS